MNLRTVKILALKASIRKWKKNLNRVRRGKLPKIGADNCPCCQVYPDLLCSGCPIKDHTHHYGCIDTPYEQIEHLVRDFSHSPDIEHWDSLATAITEEIEFLETMLESL